MTDLAKLTVVADRAEQLEVAVQALREDVKNLAVELEKPEPEKTRDEVLAEIKRLLDTLA